MKTNSSVSNIDNITKYVYGLVISRYKTIKAFSLATNLPYSTISGVFNRGIYNTNISTILSICKELNLSIDALFNYAPQQFILSKDEEEFLTIYRNSTEKEVLISFIKALSTHDTKALITFDGHRYLQID